MAPEGSGGQSFACGACGAAVAVPAESDPDCVLIYRSGLPEEGQVLTVGRFQGMVEAGELRANDLIWYQGIWMPLGEVFEMPEEKPAAPPAPGSDLAIRLEELPPMPLGGDAVVPASKKKKAKAKKAHRSRTLRRKVDFTLFRHFDQQGEKKRGLWLQVAYYAIVVVVLMCGYYMGFGKILNYVLHRPAYVLVCNGDSQDYDVRLMGNTKSALAGGTVVFPDLYVSGTRRRALEASKPGTDEVLIRTQVPLKPGMDVVVNLGGKQVFAVYDLDAMGKQRLASGDLAALAEEISTGAAPSSVFTLVSKARALAAPLLLERKTDEVITGNQYNLSKMPLFRSSDYLARTTAKAAKAAKAAEEAKKAEKAGAKAAPKLEKAPPPKYLVASSKRELIFQNCTLHYDPDQPRNNCSLRLDFKAFRPLDVTSQPETKGKTAVSELKGQVVVQVNYEKDQLVVSFTTPGAIVESSEIKSSYPAKAGRGGATSKGGTTGKGAKVSTEVKTKFSGTWSYRAWMATSGNDKDTWHWQWSFSGTAPLEKGKKTAPKMDLKVDQTRKVTKKIS